MPTAGYVQTMSAHSPNRQACDPITAHDSITAHDRITIVWHPVARLTGGGFAVGDADGGYVVVDPELDEPHRRTVVEHERVHLERGITGGWSQAPASWAAVTAREELLVNREVARRLVPGAGLQTLVAQACAAGEAVSAATVSAAFTITEELAVVALKLLAAEERGR